MSVVETAARNLYEYIYGAGPDGQRWQNAGQPTRDRHLRYARLVLTGQAHVAPEDDLA